MRLSLPCVCPFNKCILSPHVGTGGSINISHCTIRFLTHNNYRDISCENIYVVSMSTVTVGGGELVRYCFITHCTGVKAGQWAGVSQKMDMEI